MKQFIKAFIPNPILKLRTRFLRYVSARRMDAKFNRLSAADVFTTVYKKGLWGHSEDGTYFSGHGSHDSLYVDGYVEAVRGFLQGLDSKPNVVDLGCGDFNIGASLRDLADAYIACDIVPDVITENKKKYVDLAVDFRVVNAIDDTLPEGDVVIFRTVLQHLDNTSIQKIIPKLYDYRYLILTEYLPEGAFEPNMDKPMGPYSRLARGLKSGIVLTEPPFNLQCKNEIVLCNAISAHETLPINCVLKTIVYEFAS